MGPWKPTKFEQIVVQAIRNLQDVQGSTHKEISNYLAQEYNVPNGELKKHVRLALTRGVDYGLLQRQKGGTYVCNRQLLSPNVARKDDARECSTAYQKLRALRRGRRGMRTSKSRKGGRRRKSRGRGRGARSRRGRRGGRRKGGRRRGRKSRRGRSRGKR